MIHSLAGGKMKDLQMCDLAKVEYTAGAHQGQIGWYINNIFDLKIGDIVIVPIDHINNTTAKVLKIEHNISSQTAPISLKRAKEIIKKL